MSLARLVWISLLGISLSSFTPSAYAQPQTSERTSEENRAIFIEYDNIAELLQKSFHYESGNFFQKDSVEGQLKVMFGAANPLGRSSFPENEISRDAELVDIFYQDYLQQLAGDSPIRTQDLENPYSTSVRSLD